MNWVPHCSLSLFLLWIQVWFSCEVVRPYLCRWEESEGSHFKEFDILGVNNVVMRRTLGKKMNI